MKWLFTIFLVVVMSSFSGCGLIGTGGKSKNSIPQIDHRAESEMWQSLENFEEFFANTIIEASDELDRLSPKTRPNRNTLRLRSVTINASDAMLSQNDLLTAFVDAWVLCARLADYFQSGFGKKTFEPDQDIIIAAAGKILSQIENIGIEYLDEEKFESTRLKVYQFARDNPVKPGYKETVLFATEAYQGRPSPFEDIVMLPLMPFVMVNGVTGTVAGSGGMSKSLDRFADTIEKFPESAKWQMLMLLYDIEKNDSVKSTIASFSDFTKTTSRLADSAEKLPEELRVKITSLLDEIEEKSPEIQNLLKSADSTLVNTASAMKSGDKLAMSISDVSGKVASAADAWKLAADSTDAVVSRMIEMKEAKTSPEGEAFDIEDLRQTIRELNTLADNLLDVINAADTFSKKNYIRVAILVIFIFAVLFVYKLALRKMNRKP